MDWLRRNWPDLLIGVALVAVIAGIIATLISGGSFFPVGQGDRGTNTPPAQSGPATTPGQGTTTGTPQPGVTGPIGTDPSQTGAGDPGAAPGATPADDGPGIAVLPPAGSQTDAPAAGQAETPAATPGSEPTAAGSTDAPAATTTEPTGVTPLPPPGSDPGTTTSGTGTPSTPAGTPAASTPSGTSGAATGSTTAPAASAGAEEVSYRVSVGAFGNADNAQRLAQQFQGAGYPVLLGTQGQLTIVLIGPYASEAEARRVADQVEGGNFGVIDPTVYRYDPEPGGAASASASPAPSAPAASAPAASTPTASTPAASTPAATAPTADSGGAGRYLQVGAYANRESSLPQRQRLEALGFPVTEVQEGSFVKLLVGPYQGAALGDAQSVLATEGIENFARGL